MDGRLGRINRLDIAGARSSMLTNIWLSAECLCFCVHMQEVETEQFYSFFLPELQADGYEGIFAPKSRARTMTEADKQHVDGCAIFYKHSK